MSQYGWDNFKIDERGAADLKRRTLPDDLRSQMQTAIDALKKQNARAAPLLKEIAALSRSVEQHGCVLGVAGGGVADSIMEVLGFTGEHMYIFRSSIVLYQRRH